MREADETFLVILSKIITPTDATFGDNVAIGTILDNDPTGIVVIKVADATANENSGRINFKVSSAFSAATGSPFSFNYESTVDSPFKSNSSATANDFDATKGTATIPTGQSSTIISISISPDNTIEPDETFRLLLTNLSNATLDSNSAEGTILNDDLGEISGASAIIGNKQITLNWTNPNSNIFAGVTIAQATNSRIAPPSCASANNVTIIDALKTTSHTITGLINDTAYSFRICARNNDSSKISNGAELPNRTPSPIVDKDGDGLIEIATATELNNIRYNPAGTSYKISVSDTGNAVAVRMVLVMVMS